MDNEKNERLDSAGTKSSRILPYQILYCGFATRLIMPLPYYGVFSTQMLPNLTISGSDNDVAIMQLYCTSVVAQPLLTWQDARTALGVLFSKTAPKALYNFSSSSHCIP